jgi:hypothetical protein
MTGVPTGASHAECVGDVPGAVGGDVPGAVGGDVPGAVGGDATGVGTGAGTGTLPPVEIMNVIE